MAEKKNFPYGGWLRASFSDQPPFHSNRSKVGSYSYQSRVEDNPQSPDAPRSQLPMKSVVGKSGSHSTPEELATWEEMSGPLTTVVVNLNLKDGGVGDGSSKVVLEIPKISSGPEIATQWRESVDQPLIKSMHGEPKLFSMDSKLAQDYAEPISPGVDANLPTEIASFLFLSWLWRSEEDD
ncbi:hypothetical protein TorRG33x02_100230 [Trema orientale]|uniref:Uncharacterized protein n=1 Tax=Trema orientale TaxID=63057 RepID=A0A2P5F919_TREOI|nr:hypothetical protein TorRG33x02_100230 [Trema orientale]